MTEPEFLTIKWPESFVVHRSDGGSETLLRAAGVCYTPPADCPLGRGGISATVLPARSGQMSPCIRHYYFDEFEMITDTEGKVIWKQRPNKPM